MRPVLSGILFLLVFQCTASSTSLTAGVSPQVISGFQKGSSELISQYFAETIELNAPGIEGLHSRDQANFILKDFFRNHTPSGFFIKHNGDSKNGAHYSIGELNTSKGVFRVYLLYVGDANKISIRELRIESDE
jgi:hypothetical protein